MGGKPRALRTAQGGEVGSVVPRIQPKALRMFSPAPPPPSLAAALSSLASLANLHIPDRAIQHEGVLKLASNKLVYANVMPIFKWIFVHSLCWL